jgi:uncharacterized protein (TIGR03437 family)
MSLLIAAPLVLTLAQQISPGELRLNAIRRQQSLPKALAGTQWAPVGPSPASFGSALVTGRIAALAVDPRDGNVVYAGAASGGVWKTTNGGTTWTPLTDQQASLATGSIALDPAHPDTVYVGTGEETFSTSSYYGAGILKSTDGGASWTNIPGPFVGPFDSHPLDGGATIGSLAVSPMDSRVLLAGADFGQASTKSGIYRSSDSGATWKLVLPGGSGTEVLFDPTNGSVAYAALGTPSGNPANGVYKSADGGATWSKLSLSSSGAGRIRIALSASRTTTLYVAMATTTSNSDTALGIYKSTNGGQSWATLRNAPDYCVSACNYHQVIAVHPQDSNTVLMGGLVPYRSMDGGSTWRDMEDDRTGLRLHADLHALAWTADGNKLYVGCDGGVFSTTDLSSSPNTWTALNRSLAVMQFYPGMSIPPGDPTTTYVGSQDNGTLKYSGTAQWTGIACGDGGRTAIDPNTPSTVYIHCAGDQLYKSTDSGHTVAAAGTGIQSERTSFLAPLTIDPSNSRRLYFGTYRVYVSNDAAAHWTPISSDLTIPGKIFALNLIAVSPADSNTVWAASGDVAISRVMLSSNAIAGASSTWTDRTRGLPQRPPTALIPDRADPKQAFLSFSGFSGFNGDVLGHVFRTTDAGATWTDISGNLPNIPINDLVVDPDMSFTIYAATDIGVYVTFDLGATWSALGGGLPQVPVWSIALHRQSRTLRAATFGRSAWDLKIPLPVPAISAGAVVNGAWPVPNAPIAPGSIATLYGSGLAMESRVTTFVPWPVVMAGSVVLVNDAFAPLYYASPTQINFQVPWEAAGKSQASVVVNSGVASPAATVKLASYAPGLFTTNQQGSGQGAVLLSGTASIAAPTGMFANSRPAARGSYIEIYGTGLGPVSNTPADGGISPVSPLAQTTTSATVSIGGIPAPVIFAGLAPNFVGLYQINVLVPQSAPVASNVPVTLTIGGTNSNTITIAVQ